MVGDVCVLIVSIDANAVADVGDVGDADVLDNV